MLVDKTYEDKILLQRIAEGDEKAYALIIERYGSTIYAHCLLYLKDASLAEEVTQDILFHVWNKRAGLPDIGNFSNYLFIVARNRAITAFKSKLEAYEVLPTDNLSAAVWRSDTTIEYKQLQEIISRGIENLPPRRKEIFKMSRMEGMTYEQIALKLDIAKSTVKDHVLQALTFLRSYLKEEYGIVLSATLLWMNLPFYC